MTREGGKEDHLVLWWSSLIHSVIRKNRRTNRTNSFGVTLKHGGYNRQWHLMRISESVPSVKITHCAEWSLEERVFFFTKRGLGMLLVEWGLMKVRCGIVIDTSRRILEVQLLEFVLLAWTLNFRSWEFKPAEHVINEYIRGFKLDTWARVMYFELLREYYGRLTCWSIQRTITFFFSKGGSSLLTFHKTHMNFKKHV